MALQDEIETAVESLNWGVGDAAKRGRNPAFPYVPVVRYARDGRRQTQNPTRRVAFATRAEAADCAQRHIDDLKNAIKAQLAEPRYRALREQYGLPRELPATGPA